MRLLFLSVLLGFFVLAWPAPAVTAMEQWCEDDPPILILTPGGSAVVVYVTNSALGLQHLPAVTAASISHTVKSVEAGQATLVKMRVVVPDDAFDSDFPTRSVVSTGPLATGTIYASASGVSSEPMDMEFKLDVP